MRHPSHCCRPMRPREVQRRDAVAAEVGATHELRLAIDGSSVKTPVQLAVGRVAVVPPLVLRFDAESVRWVWAPSTRNACSLRTQPAARCEAGSASRVCRKPAEPADVELPGIPPGATHKAELTLVGGGRSELGVSKPRWSLRNSSGRTERFRCRSWPRHWGPPRFRSVPVSREAKTCVTSCRSRNPTTSAPYSPVWIVLAPTYEIWFSQRHGLGRTLLDSSNHSRYAWAWGSVSGLCEFCAKSVDRATIAASSAAIRTAGPNRCVARHNARMRIPLRRSDHGRVYGAARALARPRGREGVWPRLRHATPRLVLSSVFLRHSQRRSRARGAGWPDKLCDLAYCCIRQPGFSPECIWIAATDVVPRCTLHRSRHLGRMARLDEAKLRDVPRHVTRSGSPATAPGGGGGKVTCSQ